LIFLSSTFWSTTQSNNSQNHFIIAFGSVDEVVCSIHQYGYTIKDEKSFSTQASLLFERVRVIFVLSMSTFSQIGIMMS
jgi:hypothetical protein